MTNATEKQIRVLKAHMALNVKNVERSIEFYEKMLGLKPCKVRTGYAKFDVQNPPLNLTLNEVPFAAGGALSHMGLQVISTDDVLAMRAKWAKAGLVTRDEMKTNCCYAIQDKTWVHDPDGNEWEVFVVLEDNLAETSMCCVAGEDVQTVTAAGACAAPVVESEVVAETTSRGCATTAAPEESAASCCAPSAAPVGISR